MTALIVVWLIMLTLAVLILASVGIAEIRSRRRARELYVPADWEADR